MRRLFVLTALLFAILIISDANAAVITSNADPLLSGASIIDFSELPVGTANPSIAGVSFVGSGGNILISNNSGNLTPPILLNSPSDASVLDGINFGIQFSTPVSAFGADFSAINRLVTLDAFNGTTSLGSTSFNPGSPSTVLFRGLGGFGSPITSVSVTIATLDIIRLDNFHFVAVPEPSTAVETDIKPGSDPNSINPFSRGVIPVAILTTEDFDALTVDEDSVLFGPAEAEKRHKRAHVEDVDDDGDMDLLLHFRTQDTGIALGDTEPCLTGETFEGVPIMGCDSVRTVPPGDSGVSTTVSSAVSSGGACGLGTELALLLPPLMWLYRRRRRSLH